MMPESVNKPTLWKKCRIFMAPIDKTFSGWAKCLPKAVSQTRQKPMEEKEIHKVF